MGRFKPTRCRGGRPVPVAGFHPCHRRKSCALRRTREERTKPHQCALPLQPLPGLGALIPRDDCFPALSMHGREEAILQVSTRTRVPPPSPSRRSSSAWQCGPKTWHRRRLLVPFDAAEKGLRVRRRCRGERAWRGRRGDSRNDSYRGTRAVPGETVQRRGKQDITAANTTLLGGPHVPPTTRAVLISQLQALEVHIEETKSQLRNLPSRVPLISLGPIYRDWNGSRSPTWSRSPRNADEKYEMPRNLGGRVPRPNYQRSSVACDLCRKAACRPNF